MERNMINGKLALRPGEALHVAGLARDLAAGEKSARNKISLGRFPFPLTIIAGKKLVLVRDLLLALDEPATNDANQSDPSLRIELSKPGRKTNASKAMAGRQGGAS